MNQPQINPNVSVDCAIFSFDGSDLEVLLIERMAGETALEDDLLALPGNLIYQD